METFTPIRPFEPNPDFAAQRETALAGFSRAQIDAPIAGMMADLNRLSYCFSLQCCYGHFLCPGQDDEHSLQPLPQKADGIHEVDYRIAYVALCLDVGPAGRDLLRELHKITGLDPGNIQLGCADWFWQRQVNSFALQLEPERFMHLDRTMLPFNEARRLEKLRGRMFARLQSILKNLQ